MSRSRPFLTIVFVLMSLAVYIWTNMILIGSEKHTPLQSSSLILQVPPRVLKVLAGEFSGILADKIILDATAFLGGRRIDFTAEDWKHIFLSLQQSLTLDPYFQQTYMIAQGYLPWDANMPRKANQLLDISRKSRPYDWRPGYYMGFNSYYFLNDYTKAGKIFLETAKIPGAPVLLAVLGARLSAEGNQGEAAITLLLTILNEVREEPALEDRDRIHRIKEITDRIKALKGVILLEKAAKHYRDIFGHFPLTLQKLVERGIMQHLPENPYGDQYSINPLSGKVSFDNLTKQETLSIGNGPIRRNYVEISTNE